MNSHLESLCRKIGLEGKEATLFINVATGGRVTASTLSETTGCNRATVYHVISTLHQKGLVQRELLNGSYYYFLSDEATIKGYINKKIYELENAKETITNVIKRIPKHKNSGSDTSVQVFSGEEGVTFAFEIAFQARKKEWDIIAPKNNFLTLINEAFVERYLKKRKNIKTRTLWELDASKKLPPKEILKERNVHYLSEEYRNTFTSLIIIFDQSALFVSHEKDGSATLIQSESAILTLRILFDVAWKSALVPK